MELDDNRLRFGLRNLMERAPEGNSGSSRSTPTRWVTSPASKTPPRAPRPKRSRDSIQAPRNGDASVQRRRRAARSEPAGGDERARRDFQWWGLAWETRRPLWSRETGCDDA